MLPVAPLASKESRQLPCSIVVPAGTVLAVRKEIRWTVALTCLAALGYAAWLVFSPFLASLTWAIILAILLAPVQRWLSRWIPWKGLCSLVTCLLAALILLGPAAALGTALVGEVIEGLQYVQVHAEELRDLDPANWAAVVRLRSQLETWLVDWLGEPGFQEMVRVPDLGATVVSAAQGLSQWLLNRSSSVFRNLAGLAFTTLVTWLILFYLLRDGDRLLDLAIEMMPYPGDRKEAMLERLNDVVISTVYGGLAVALTQGILGGVAFAVLGLPSPVLWGTVMAIFSFLPLVGAVVVWGPAAVILLIQGRWLAALGLAVWGSLAVGLVDNFLRPLLISGRTALHPLLIFLAVLGGIQAFGVLGLFLGPVLVAVVSGLVDLYRGMVAGEFGGSVESEGITAEVS